MTEPRKHTGGRKPGGLSETPGALRQRNWRLRKKLESGVAAKLPPRVPVTADIGAALAWIRETLIVPSGPLAGQPFVIHDWQAEWLIAASDPAVKEAGLSIARKNGKSGLIAAWLLAYLCGPLNARDWRGVVTSLTGPLALELRNAIWDTAVASALSPLLRLWKSPVPGRIEGRNKAEVRFLAADKATGHGIGADLAMIDEAGLLEEKDRALWNAMKSAVSGRDGAFWCISIQGHGPMFAELEAKDGLDDVHWRRWQADEKADISDPEAWAQGNPGLAGGIKSSAYMERQARNAVITPADESHFRAYDLNQSVDPKKESIVSVRDWMACAIQPAAQLADDGAELVVGVDLGGTVSMTSAVALNPRNGAVLVRGAFGDDPPLSERAKQDRVGTKYDVMVRRGELRIYPGRVTPVTKFLADFFAECAEHGRVLVIGCDRYRKAEFEKALEDAGIPRHVEVAWRGTGAGATADGSRDVREFQRLVRKRRLRPGESPMMELAIANSVIRYDTAGNPALDKRNSNARIDALSAAVIAAGLAAAMPAEGPLLKLHVV